MISDQSSLIFALERVEYIDEQKASVLLKREFASSAANFIQLLPDDFSSHRYKSHSDYKKIQDDQK
jgi:hypothetical protein